MVPLNLKEKLRPYRSCLTVGAVPLFMLFLFALIRRNRNAVKIYVSRFSLPLRRAVGSVTTLVPFSAAELCYALAFVGCIFYICRTGYLIFKHRLEKEDIIRRVLWFIIALLLVWSLYCLIFGLDYYGESFSEKAGIGEIPVTREELISVTRHFAEKCIKLSIGVPRGGGVFSVQPSAIIDEYYHIYSGIRNEFPFLDMPTFRPKEMIFSGIMSAMGFTGVYFPFTGETNINIDAPQVFMPCTVAHEIAHQMGITSESECNFIGILASTTCGIDFYEYSGYMTGLVHLMNALYSVDTHAWREIRAEFTDGMNADWQQNADYWDEHEMFITDVSSKLYDMYLKGYGEELGIVSYSACVKLLVHYYKDAV